MLAAGRSEFDPAKRKQIYRAVQKMSLEKCPYVSLAWRSQGYAMKKEVQGFVNIPGPITFYSGTTLEQTTV